MEWFSVFHKPGSYNLEEKKKHQSLFAYYKPLFVWMIITYYFNHSSIIINKCTVHLNKTELNKHHLQIISAPQKPLLQARCFYNNILSTITLTSINNYYLSREVINNLLLYTFVLRINYLQCVYNKNVISALKQVTIQ